MFKRLALLAFASAFAFAAAPALLGTPAAPAQARSYASHSCSPDTYVNSSGHCVHRPVVSQTVPPARLRSAEMGPIASANIDAALAVITGE